MQKEKLKKKKLGTFIVAREGTRGTHDHKTHHNLINLANLRVLAHGTARDSSS